MAATVAVALVALVSALVSESGDRAGAATALGPRGAASTVAYRVNSTRSFQLTLPAGAQPGDLLVATLGFSHDDKGNASATAPAGWRLAVRVNQKKVAGAVYTKVLAAGETSFTWTFGSTVGGEATLAAFSGIDQANPVDAAAAKAVTGTRAAAPSITTTGPNAVLVAGFVGYRRSGSPTTWTPPAGMAELGDVADPAGNHTGSVHHAIRPVAGPTGAQVGTASRPQDGAVAISLALRASSSASTTTTSTSTTSPSTTTTSVATTSTTSTTTTTTTTTTIAPGGSGAVPLIVDTDLFSDADDVGALATAFGLQLRGEARVLAIGVNTRLSRPEVATNSWRCAAAVADWYGFGSTPIGTSLPNEGTERNTVDFAGPCARLAPAGTPVPGSAVTTFRRALASQADGSVVVVQAGYSGNLAALLASPPDAISALSGRDLVARKVKRLVWMGGGFPSDSGETNLQGDVESAQAVATGWPTEIVWAGWEVGDEIHTGNTISTTHPSTSPVRVAYEAFVGPRNWIYSYDLVAAYWAVRSDDPALGRVGPGTNQVRSDGSNRWVAGSGNQSYLTLKDASSLDASIEALITTLPGTTPPPPPDEPPPTGGSLPNDTFSGTTLGAAWTAVPGGSSVGVAGGQLQVAHPAGGWTKGEVRTSTPFDATGRTVSVQLKRAANAGQGGSTFGETSVILQADDSHQLQFFVAGGSMTAWIENGSAETNLNPSWPRYDPAAMQWLRFRLAGGQVVFEYASGSSSPGPWTTLATATVPFSLGSADLRLIAGTNAPVADVSAFDNVATS